MTIKERIENLTKQQEKAKEVSSVEIPARSANFPIASAAGSVCLPKAPILPTAKAPASATPSFAAPAVNFDIEELTCLKALVVLFLPSMSNRTDLSPIATIYAPF